MTNTINTDQVYYKVTISTSDNKSGETNQDTVIEYWTAATFEDGFQDFAEYAAAHGDYVTFRLAHPDEVDQDLVIG